MFKCNEKVSNCRCTCFFYKSLIPNADMVSSWSGQSFSHYLFPAIIIVEMAIFPFIHSTTGWSIFCRQAHRSVNSQKLHEAAAPNHVYARKKEVKSEKQRWQWDFLLFYVGLDCHNALPEFSLFYFTLSLKKKKKVIIM